MTRFPLYVLANLLAALLLIVAIRAVGEAFRLEYVRAEFPSYDELRPFPIGAMAALLALAAMLLAIWTERPGTAIVLACFTIGGLLVYSIYFFPPAAIPPAPAPAAVTPPA